MSKLLLDQAVSPSRLQAFAGLDNVFLQMVSLGGNELLCTAEDSFALGRHCGAGQGIKSVLKKRREVIFTRHSCLPSNSIKTVTIFIRSAVDVIIELVFRRIMYLLPISKGELFLLWWLG